jgi:hypothetical protein
MGGNAPSMAAQINAAKELMLALGVVPDPLP